jgi:hypothetical protein
MPLGLLLLLPAVRRFGRGTPPSLLALVALLFVGAGPLQAQEKVRLVSGVLDNGGTAVPAVTVNQQFTVRVYGQDVRATPTGLRGWLVNLNWNSSVIRNDDPLDADKFNGDEVTLGIIDAGVWDGPTAGAKLGDSIIEDLVGTQSPPATRPLGSTTPVLLFKLKFTALQPGAGGFVVAPADFSFVGGGLAADGEYDLTGLRAITVVGPVVASAGSDKLIAQGGWASLEGSATGGLGPYTYEWSPTSGLDNPNAAQPDASPSSTTTYTLTVTDDLGQTDTDDVVVTVASLVVADAGPDKVVKGGDSVVLAGGASGGVAPYTYDWSPSTGLDDPSAEQPVASPVATTVYTLTVTDDLGQVDTDEVTVEVADPVVADAGPDKDVAVGSSVTLEGAASGGYPPLSYEWSPATGLSATDILQPEASPAVTTVYTLTVTDSLGQVDGDDVTITVVDTVVANAGPDKTIAPGGSTVLEGSASGGVPDPDYIYEWSPTTGLNDPNVAQPVASPATSTTYTLTVTDSLGQNDSDDVLVTVASLLVVSAGADVIIGPGESANLQGSASGGLAPYTYLWQPAQGLSDPAVLEPIASPASTTTYTLTVTDALNQVVQDDVVVSVTIAADFNRDGSVDIFDYSPNGFLDAWGGTDPLYDLNGDGEVFHLDYFMFLDAYGGSMP